MKRLFFGTALACMAGACVGDDTAPGAATGECAGQGRRPVLFVHGSGHGAHSWNVMRRAFANAGYPEDWLHAVQLEPNHGANVRAAERFIAPAAQTLLERARVGAQRAGCAPPAKLDMVSHSMGAVSSRWYATRMAPDLVHTWVGITPSNHGTDRLCGHEGEGNREMCPAFAPDGAASAVQFELNGSRTRPRDETPYGQGVDSDPSVSIAPTPSRAIRYFTIRIEPDEWLLPADTALLDGAGDGTGKAPPRLHASMKETAPGNLLFLERLPHDWLPTNDTVIATVIALLGHVP